MDDIRKFINEVLTKGNLVSLATVDNNGPWVSDVLYIHDSNFSLYWVSRLNTRHSKAIEKNPHVAGAITVEINEPDMGVQLEGIAEKVKGDIGDIPRAYWEKRGELDRLTQPMDPELVWYRLKPTKIELIYEHILGHGKKILKLP